MDQLVNVLLTIDEAHIAPEGALDCGTTYEVPSCKGWAIRC